MKKILFFLIGIALISCDKNDTPAVEKTFNHDVDVVIKPADGVQLRSTAGLTALEIVERAESIVWQSHWFYDYYNETPDVIGRGFNEHQKDFDIPALKMFSIDVIGTYPDIPEPVYKRIFTHGFSVYITDINGDSIAYVPDEVINTARPLIESAFEAGDYEEVYRLFEEAFTFLPLE